MRMLKYYAIASVIVLTIVVIATMRFHSFAHMRLRSSNHSPPPQHLRYGDSSGENTGALSGDAPWALSALPDCFKQKSEWTGSATYVDSRVPRAAHPIPPGAQLRFGPCTILVRNGELYVSRGADHFRIPPNAVLYRNGSLLLLLRTTPQSTVLRSYTSTATP